jgi:hypothetical protein
MFLIQKLYPANSFIWGVDSLLLLECPRVFVYTAKAKKETYEIFSEDQIESTTTSDDTWVVLVSESRYC